MGNVELGSFLIYLTIAVAGIGVVFSLWGVRTNREDLMAAGRNAVFAVLALTTLAVLRLEWALHTHDFSLEYVWGYTDRSMPVHYLTAALWGGMNGSLLFWAWILAIYSAIAVIWGKRKAPELLPYAIAALLVTWILFGLIIALEANPFDLVRHPATGELFTPADGRGLNPLLQNYWMMIHPVMLYVGFVGFTVPFAFCIGALATGKLDAGWMRSTRRWALWAWGILAVAIVLGGTWAYEELGWGGYWAWDPVENASFFPWLTATAYIHSVIIQEKKNMLKVWNVVLILLTFFLCIFATFLTRSGVVQSVHAFGEGAIGWYFITFLLLAILISTALIIYRFDRLVSDKKLESLMSRETLFFINNWLFLVFAAIVITGTLLPVFTEMIAGVKWNVGAPFFNLFVVPTAMFLLILTALGQAVAWRKTSTSGLMKTLTIPSIVGVIALLIFGYFAILAGDSSWLAKTIEYNGWTLGDARIRSAQIAAVWAVIGFSLCTFLAAGVVWEFTRAIRSLSSKFKGIDAFLALFRNDVNRRRYGGYLVHLAFCVVCAGMIGSSAFNTEKALQMEVGEEHTVGPWTFTLLREPDVERTPEYDSIVATIRLEKNGEKVGTMFPERRFYPKQEQPSTEPSIAVWAMNDVYMIIEAYASKGGQQGLPAAPITTRLYINPMIQWIWKGTFLFGLATIVCYWPARKKVTADAPAREKASVPAGARVGGAVQDKEADT